MDNALKIAAVNLATWGLVAIAPGNQAKFGVGMIGIGLDIMLYVTR